MAKPRTATVRARTLCDMFVLEKADFSRALREFPKFAETMMKVAKGGVSALLTTSSTPCVGS